MPNSTKSTQPQIFQQPTKFSIAASELVFVLILFNFGRARGRWFALCVRRGGRGRELLTKVMAGEEGWQEQAQQLRAHEWNRVAKPDVHRWLNTKGPYAAEKPRLCMLGNAVWGFLKNKGLRSQIRI